MATCQLASGLVLLAVIWLSTALVQVLCHDVLSRGFDAVVQRRLFRTNWIRTAAWSLRGALVLGMLLASSRWGRAPSPASVAHGG